MTDVDWDEIKRLASDLQRAQLTSTTQRLAERNCVEIISKLIRLKLLDVIFTTDGKEYITPKHLTTEIQNELYANGGRINLTELASILNVDLTHIKSRIPELLGLNSGIQEVLGQLINSTYKRRIAEEINVKLAELGQLSIGDLAHSYDLPPEFMKQLVERNLGKIIQGKQDKRDPQVFFTEAFLARNIASIRGALMALTRPTPISMVLSKCCIQESLFFSLLGTLTESKQIPGVVTGNKSAAGIYVPTMYAKSQTLWVDHFYKQNGFLEYDALARLGISDGRTFVKKHFPNEKLVILQSAAVGPALLEQVEAAVEEAIGTGKWIDIMTLLPTVIDVGDARAILQEVIKSLKCATTTHVFCGTIVLTETFLQSIAKPFDKIIHEKAEQCVSSGAFLAWQLGQTQGSTSSNKQEEETISKVDKRDERRKKAAGGKGGGGTQGRETKTKSTKKKQRGRGGYDSDDEIVDSKKCNRTQLELLTKEDIVAVLADDESLAEGEEENDLVDQLSEYFYPLLNKKAVTVAAQIVESNVANSAGERRKTHSDLQDKFNAEFTNIKLLEKGIRQFPNTPSACNKESTQVQLVKYLLKSLCTEMVNEIFGYVAQERMMQWDPAKEITSEARIKLAQDIGGQVKDTLVRLNKTLNGTSIDDFLAAVEPALGTDVCDMVVRKPDKKKERILVFGHRQALLEQLNSADDPALVLHLTALILFQTVSQCMLHASGKFVSPILDFIKPHIPPESFKILREYHDLVMKQFAATNATGSGDEGNDQRSIKIELINGMSAIKEIATTFKKSSAASTEN